MSYFSICWSVRAELKRLSQVVSSPRLIWRRYYGQYIAHIWSGGQGVHHPASAVQWLRSTPEMDTFPALTRILSTHHGQVRLDGGDANCISPGCPSCKRNREVASYAEA
jgi:hypothetical protein